MEQRSTTVEEERWRVLWRAIGEGDNPVLNIPAKGSFVYYDPQGHAMQSEPTEFSEFPNSKPLLCQVLDVSFMSRPPPDCRVYVKFWLEAATPHEVEEKGAGDHIHIDEPGAVFESIPCRFLEMEGTTVSKDMAQQVIGHLPPPKGEEVLEFWYMDEDEPVLMRYFFDGEFMRLAWDEFRQERDIDYRRDILVFTNINGRLSVGLRRPAIYKVPWRQHEYAVECHFYGVPFSVDYYPSAGPSFVAMFPNA